MSTAWERLSVELMLRGRPGEYALPEEMMKVNYIDPETGKERTQQEIEKEIVNNRQNRYAEVASEVGVSLSDLEFALRMLRGRKKPVPTNEELRAELEKWVKLRAELEK